MVYRMCIGERGQALLLLLMNDRVRTCISKRCPLKDRVSVSVDDCFALSP